MIKKLAWTATSICALTFAFQSSAFAGATLTNADFQAESGQWGDGNGPVGWTLSLGADDQVGLVSDAPGNEPGRLAFRFNRVQRGFGDSRLDQCVVLGDVPGLQLSADIWTDEPDPELTVRLRVDFYADENCNDDSANADAEQIQTDIGLSEARIQTGQWTRLESELRLAGELGADVRSARISLRLRDRSDNGQPRDPARVVWFDQASLDTDLVLLPDGQREALRALYQATDGPNWSRQLNWMGAVGTECSWEGVVCSEDRSTVERLALPARGLTGSLPTALRALDDLRPGEGLDLCWNDVLVPSALSLFMQERHLGGNPAFCQGVARLPGGLDRAGQWFQPADRNGEGFMLHMLSAGSAVFKWASYRDDGQPIWLIGTGRMQDRVLHIPDLYHTRLQEGQVELERIGRAALAFTDDDVTGGDCPLAILRFHASGTGFEANSGRELRYLEGSPECLGLPPHLPELAALQGSWYDPTQPGQGISLVPHVGDRVIMNWYGHGDDGGQIWQFGVGFPNEALDRIEFPALYSTAGGNFDGVIDQDELALIPQGSASLQKEGDAWRFEALQGSLPVSLLMEVTVAGPDLLASTGQRIDLSMDPADLEELYSRPVFSDDRLPGTVTFNQDGQEQPLTGLRFRGNSSRFLPKKSFNIRFEDAQSLLFGSDRMNLNAMWTDPSMMRESISFELFHELGQPAPRTRYFDLWINGLFEGTYLHIQRIDEFFLEMNGLNPEGTLVRDGARGDADVEGRSFFAADLTGLDAEERLALIEETFDFRGDPDWQSLLDLVEWVQNTPPGASFASGFAERVDIDNFIDWLALHWLIGDIDSFGDDYWLYLDHPDASARWKFIPWDKDLSFGSHFRAGFSTHNDFFSYEYPLRGGWENRLIEKVLATPSLREQIDNRLLELIDEVFTPAWFDQRFGSLKEKLEDSINIQPGPVAFNVHESNHFSVPEQFDNQIEALSHFVKLRQALIDRQVRNPGGETDQASAVLAAGQTDRVFLADQDGAVLASIRPLSKPTNDITVSVSLEAASPSATIDRAWSWIIESDEAIPVELTLHYSNEISSSFGRGNWWVPGADPIGRQAELQILILDEEQDQLVLETTVNPISNWAQSEWLLESGETTIELRLPETIPPTMPEIPSP
ncbi:MAG: CotH kinase family protein [Wenzhouxiangella sp.]